MSFGSLNPSWVHLPIAIMVLVCFVQKEKAIRAQGNCVSKVILLGIHAIMWCIYASVTENESQQGRFRCCMLVLVCN